MGFDFEAEEISDSELAALTGSLTPEMEAEVEQAITKALDRFSEYFGQGFERPNVVYDLRGHTAGYANSKRIRLNPELLVTHHEDMINQTIPHEVAHVVQGQLYPQSKSHGYEWQRLMHILGIPARTTHSYKTTPARVRAREYTYYCNCPEPHFVTKTLHRRMQQGRIYTCRRCKSQLRERG